MKIIFAQGNPGKKYEKTRHNVGFLALDALSATLDASWHESSKFNALIAEATVQVKSGNNDASNGGDKNNGGDENNASDEKVLLVKPLSFYNDTGPIARALVDFYKIAPAKDLLVIHDELALPLGTLRLREKGRDAGNNGIKSLNSHLGQGYWRIRVGTWTPLRNERDDTDFVLSALTSDELTLLHEKVYPVIEEFCGDFIRGKGIGKSVKVE